MSAKSLKISCEPAYVNPVKQRYVQRTKKEKKDCPLLVASYLRYYLGFNLDTQPEYCPLSAPIRCNECTAPKVRPGN